MADSFVILASDTQWRIGSLRLEGPVLSEVPGTPGESPQAIAANVAAALASHGYAGRGALLAIPSSWCLPVNIPTRRLPAKPSRQELLYMLEQRLPLATEEIAADFLDNQDVFAVAVHVRTLQPLIAALEARGVVLEGIHPASMLALQHLQGLGEADAVIMGSGAERELFMLCAGKPIAWRLIGNDEEELVQLRAAAVGRSTPVRVLCADEAIRARLPQIANIAIHSMAAAPVDATAVLAAANAVRGKPRPWFDLRRDALAPGASLDRLRRPLSAAVAMAVLLCLCACGAMLWRAHQYDRMAQQHEGEQVAIFRQAFPGRSVQPNIPMYLESEARKLGPVVAGMPEPRRASALLLLRDVLLRIPADVRCRITRLDLVDERLRIDGEALSHADADAIATALRGGRRLRVDPPRTELTPRGVSFTITGEAAGRVAEEVPR